jgi:putative peptide zinc metalloprotease protein
MQRHAAVCASCGAVRDAGSEILELVLPDGTRVVLDGTLTIGRGSGSSIRLPDPSVSRTHATISAPLGSTPELADAGSSHGTFLDGERVREPLSLTAGSTVRVGDTDLRVEQRRGLHEAGATIVLRAGMSLTVPTVDDPEVRARLRDGLLLKRLDASEGTRRFVLKDPEQKRFLRLGPDDAALLELLGRQDSLVELAAASERLLGPAGPARLASLLVELGDRGLLEGTDAELAAADTGGRLRRLFRPRVHAFEGASGFFETLYRSGGFVLFSLPGLWTCALLAGGGLITFIAMIATQTATPFVVADRLSLGAAVFLLGRALVVTLHELAHGLCATSFDRAPERAGVKLMLIFPYAFVDTSDAWFEPRRRRIAVSAAGPVSDLVVGGSCALLGLATGGSLRDVFFQVALAAYVGALFNLNPLIDRDGYQILVDLLREPGLRKRARAWLSRRLAGSEEPATRRALAIYAFAGLAWSLATACFVVAISLFYYQRLQDLAPRWVVWLLLACFDIAMFLPVIILLWRPLTARWRARSDGSEADHVAV